MARTKSNGPKGSTANFAFEAKLGSEHASFFHSDSSIG